MAPLTEIIIKILTEILQFLFKPITGFIELYARDLVTIMVSTPHPANIFGSPSTEPWITFYQYYWKAIIPLSIFIWTVSVGCIIFFESTSFLFSTYTRGKLKKRALVGICGILSWWWIGAISLQFADALTRYFVPHLDSISLFQTLSFSAMGILGLVVALSTDLIIFFLLAIIYLLRYLGIYVLMISMPLLIALWVPGVGPLAYISKFVQRIAGLYIPLLFMTVPVALLFRISALLGRSFGVSLGGFSRWLLAITIPIFALLVPLIFLWQGSALFGTVQRMTGYFHGHNIRDRHRSIRQNLSTESNQTIARDRPPTLPDTGTKASNTGISVNQTMRTDHSQRKNNTND